MDALEHDDTEPLIKMLLDPKQEVTPAVRLCLADLLKRHTLGRRRGERQVPIWAVSQSDVMFLLMTRQVLKLKENGTPHEDAIERTASKWDVDLNTLADAVNGRRGSLQRTRKRLSRLMSKESDLSEFADFLAEAHKPSWRPTDPDVLMARLRESVLIDDPGE
jgi:hypothetical protein